MLIFELSPTAQRYEVYPVENTHEFLKEQAEREAAAAAAGSAVNA